MKKSLVSLVLGLGLGLLASFDDIAMSQELQKQTFTCQGARLVNVFITMLMEVEPSNASGFAKIEISQSGKPDKQILGIAQQGLWTLDRLTIHSIDEATGNYHLSLFADDYFARTQGESFTAQLVNNGFTSLVCTLN